MRAAPRAVQDSQSSHRASFTAAHRLRRSNGFDHVIQAHSIADSRFRVFFVGNDKGNARLGIVLRKKKVSRAADRNRIKRIVREAFRRHCVKLCNLDIVVMVKELDPDERALWTSNLNSLFNRIESKCAEL